MKLRPFLLPTLLIAVVAMTFTFFSCKKSSNSKPTITLKSMDMHVPVGGTFTATFDFKDPSSTMSQGYFVAIRQRVNKDTLTGSGVPNDTLSAAIPNFPDQQTGQIQFTKSHADLFEGNNNENDTLIFKFACINRQGVSSDTITSPKVVVDF
jgi:hypothetical protein